MNTAYLARQSRLEKALFSCAEKGSLNNFAGFLELNSSSIDHAVSIFGTSARIKK